MSEKQELIEFTLPAIYAAFVEELRQKAIQIRQLDIEQFITRRMDTNRKQCAARGIGRPECLSAVELDKWVKAYRHLDMMRVYGTEVKTIAPRCTRRGRSKPPQERT